MKDAKGHGSNPRGYRGKHPTRIKTVHGAGVGTAHAVTNSGDRYRIRAADNADQYMYLRSGKDIKDYPKAERLPANDEQAASQLASGPKSAPAPVHEAMRYAPDHPGSNDARVKEAVGAMSRLRDTFRTGNNRYGEYGRNVREAHDRHAKLYAQLTGKKAPSIYD